MAQQSELDRDWNSASLDESYDDYPRIEEQFQEYLDGSLNPQGPESLYDLVASLGLRKGAVAIDVGCGEGANAVELASRFGLLVHSVDPVERHIELGAALAKTKRVSDLVDFQVAAAEKLPFPDESVDLVWCKETLMF